jgi:hypothetical protein
VTEKMNEQEFKKLKTKLQKQSIYYLLGYFMTDIERGFIDDPLAPCTEEQAKILYRMLYEKAKKLPLTQKLEE